MRPLAIDGTAGIAHVAHAADVRVRTDGHGGDAEGRHVPRQGMGKARVVVDVPAIHQVCDTHRAAPRLQHENERVRAASGLAGHAAAAAIRMKCHQIPFQGWQHRTVGGWTEAADHRPFPHPARCGEGNHPAVKQRLVPLRFKDRHGVCSRRHVEVGGAGDAHRAGRQQRRVGAKFGRHHPAGHGTAGLRGRAVRHMRAHLQNCAHQFAVRLEHESKPRQ